MLLACEEDKLTDAQLNIFRNPCPEEELFQVSEDPHQIDDLAQDAEYGDILEEMRSQLDLWTKQTGDTVPEDPTPNTPQGTRIRDAPHREMPGAAAGAEMINHPGPVKR